MRMTFQLGLREHPPLWLRVLTVFCIVAVCTMSTAQISHTHTGFTLLKQGPHHNAPTPDDHCPLCVAMHSALAAPQHFAPEPTLTTQRLDSVAVEVARIFRWRFQMACRPPPAGDYA